MGKKKLPPGYEIRTIFSDGAREYIQLDAARHVGRIRVRVIDLDRTRFNPWGPPWAAAVKQTDDQTARVLGTDGKGYVCPILTKQFDTQPPWHLVAEDTDD